MYCRTKLSFLPAYMTRNPIIGIKFKMADGVLKTLCLDVWQPDRIFKILHVRQSDNFSLSGLCTRNSRVVDYSSRFVALISLAAPHSMHHQTWKLMCFWLLPGNNLKTLPVRQSHNFLISSRFTQNSRFM